MKRELFTPENSNVYLGKIRDNLEKSIDKKHLNCNKTSEVWDHVKLIGKKVN